MSRRRAAPKFRGGLGSSGPRTDSGVWVGRGPDGLGARIRPPCAAPVTRGLHPLYAGGGASDRARRVPGSVARDRWGSGGEATGVT